MSGKVSQFVTKVVNFSSQYGTEGSSSYTASNLAGQLHIYDGYGDRTEAFVLRTYGRLWKECPSAPKKFINSPLLRSEDFVEVQFDQPVIPDSIDIYETYHPGAVVRILACNNNPLSKRQPGEVEWVTLWSGATQCSNERKSRKFSPPLKRIEFPTNLLRLEFNSEDCRYYTELDGVELHGHIKRGLVSFHDRAMGFQMSVTNKLLNMLSLTDRQLSVGDEDDDTHKWGYFSRLPDELIQYIFKFLDLKSLCSASQVCSLFLKNAYDPMLYRELNLQPHWNTIDDVALAGLCQRCSQTSRLNLSWIGGGGQITEISVCKFIEQCGSNLSTLQLSCCKFIGEKTLQTIGNYCPQIEELDLQSCLQLETAVHHVKHLHHLRRLNLYSCTLTAELFDIIGSQCQELEHLNIGASVLIHGVQESHLNSCLRNLRKLISLDLWRCRVVSSATIETIAHNCENLEEIDIGWCHTILKQPFDHQLFFKNCTKLKKIFLTCGRAVDDSCLENIAMFCSDMQQLDILGSNRVTNQGAERVLQSCKRLRFLDVSFCSKINISDFEAKYPHVTIKNSFQ